LANVHGGYNAENRPYTGLVADQKLIGHLPEADWHKLATKYYCFDLVNAKKFQGPGEKPESLVRPQLGNLVG
jgi:hypothetical protein